MLKYRFLYKKSIRNKLEVWITQSILDDISDEGAAFEIPEKFRRILQNKVARQFVIDELVSSKKNLTGTAGNNIVKLYEELDLKKDSLEKMSSTQWYIKAKGIQELYLMDQNDMLKRIYKNINSRNEYIRMEAQTGIIHMSGFDGLRFLDVVAYPLTEWQQLKLLDQLKLNDVKENFSQSIIRWLTSHNDTVIIFALKLAAEYQQFSVHNDAARALHHTNGNVRYQAIKTLKRLANETTASLLANHFPKENQRNRLLILEVLTDIGSVEQTNFLENLLNVKDITIQLKAATALAKAIPGGNELLYQKAIAQPDLLSAVYLHVKAALKL
ncbi:MAG: HEAT repeat domain-containing protein [Bacteroidota bacterium]|nr:HEAT repeat domain-containing protein [Bacteroidota bacterium]